MLSQTAEYALRAVLYVGAVHPESVRVSEVAEAIDAPRNYLAKILGTLARAGVLESTRGPMGGFRLARRPDALALSQIMAALDGTVERRCLLGRGRCGDTPGCTAHARWAPIATAVDAFFGKTTLADLLSPRTT